MMQAQKAREDSRPTTPESPLASSLHHATSTIDDLTHALANFSRVPSPEHPQVLACCCGRDDCENVIAWQAVKSQMESRLILSAEVGQALLQRHEAYVRRHENRLPRRVRQASPSGGPMEHFSENSAAQEQVESMAELLKDRVALEKRLNKALVNSEAADLSKKSLLAELEDLKATVTKLTAHHARSIGWDTRLAAALQQRDDMRQERDSEAQRARIAENRIAALKERASKFQAEVRRLQDDHELRQIHRLASSESILQEARSHLELLHRSHTSPITLDDHPEVTKVLESLVADNEVLKQDNAQLQNLLTEAREDLNAAQEELEEKKAQHPATSADAGIFYTGSMPSPGFKEPPNFKRNASVERRPRRLLEPLTPETGNWPLSPAGSISFSRSVHSEDEDGSVTPERRKTHKPLFLLARSRGVQTDPYPYSHSLASPLPSHMSSHPRSESSSFSDVQSSSASSPHLSSLIERVTALLTRLTQADALTLTNRLKRQHLRGADVSHLSKSTVNAIMGEANNLRSQYRALLEDEAATTVCTRKDLRGLLKLFREIFAELGQMRILINDVVLDPASASRLSEAILNPAKLEAEQHERERLRGESTNNSSWMTPISKLFGAQSDNFTPSTVTRAQPQRALSVKRIVPKLGPALAASATTVNVEFTGSGASRAVTSSASAAVHSPTPQRATNQVMGIFAGAPRILTPDKDPWVVIGSRNAAGPRRMQSTMLRPSNDMGNNAANTAFRAGNPSRLSRNIDAIIDSETRSPRTGQGEGEEPDYLAPLLQRTLRRRGLSDSSIHSSFMSQGAEAPEPAAVSAVQASSIPDRGSVLQAFSKRMQGFRSGLSVLSSPPPALPISPPPPTAASQTTESSFASMIPNLATWSAGGPGSERETFFSGSMPRDESVLHQHIHRTLEPFNLAKREYY